MTLATLSSQVFSSRVGSVLVAETADGDVVLDILGVNENPLGAGPGAGRTPFTVLVRGPASPSLADGCYGIRGDRVEDGDPLDQGAPFRLEGIFLNRVLPAAGTDGIGAFYQMVFA